MAQNPIFTDEEIYKIAAMKGKIKNIADHYGVSKSTIAACRMMAKIGIEAYRAKRMEKYKRKIDTSKYVYIDPADEKPTSIDEKRMKIDKQLKDLRKILNKYSNRPRPSALHHKGKVYYIKELEYVHEYEELLKKKEKLKMTLTDHFTLPEFEKSKTATEENIINKAQPKAIVNLIRLCISVLEPVRAHFGKPVKITSGYRSVKLNKAIGGAKNSQHTKGQAADFVIKGVDLDEIYEYMKSSLVYDQLIREPSWIHVSFNRSGKNRMKSWRKN